jgi:hypothetical protein
MSAPSSSTVRLAAAAACVVAAACTPDMIFVEPGIDLVSARIPLAAEGACSSDPGAGFAEFTDEVGTLRVVVTGPGIDEPISAEGSIEELTVDEIPAGVDRIVTLSGLNDNGAATWRAYRSGIAVETGTDTRVDMLMSRIADLSCPRTAQNRARAFHTATRLADGRVLLIGGADVIADCLPEGCLDLSASSFAEIYDPKTGAFTATTGALQRNRMFHTATLLDDGRVLIAGGASQAQIVPVDGANPFPIRILQGVRMLEIFDPTRGDFTAIGDDSVERAFHSASPTEDGGVVLTGGIPGLPQNGINDLNNALASTTKCSGSPIACVPYASMQKARAGHMSFLSDGGDVYIWGGSVDTLTTTGGLLGYHIERLAGGQFTLIDVPGMDTPRNVFFGAATVYLESPTRVLMTGGLVRASDGTFSLATVPGSSGTKGAVYIYNLAANQGAGQLGASGPSTPPMELATPRFFAGAGALPDKKRVVIAGGFSSLGFTPSQTLDIYDESSLTVNALSVGGQPRTLREPRGGVVATAIGDGTVLFSGGQTDSGVDARPLATAEIFTDPTPPTGVTP